MRYAGAVRDWVRKFGWDISRYRPQPSGVDPVNAAIVDRVVPTFTLTPDERVSVLVDAVRYLERAGIAGAIVEAGVWRGGSMMAAALTLLESEYPSRELWLYDTFEGMSDPTEFDRDLNGNTAEQMLARIEGTEASMGDWCNASIEDVHANMRSTGYPDSLVHYVKGNAEDTITKDRPSEIALLRIDTDWYEPTKASLEGLFPSVSRGGIIILDDYGHWDGARRAVDEYFAENGPAPLLVSTDYAARLIVKT